MHVRPAQVAEMVFYYWPPRSILVLCPDHTSQEENGLVNQVKFLGLLPACGKDQWDCNIVNYYVHTHYSAHKLRCAKFCFPVSAFDLIRERYVVVVCSFLHTNLSS